MNRHNGLHPFCLLAYNKRVERIFADLHRF